MSVAIAQANPRWLFGAKPDLLFGCGLFYLAFFSLLVFQGEVVESLFPYALTPLVALFLSIPHYGSTLLRVYETQEARQKYQIFSVYLSGLILAWFVWSVYYSAAGTLLVTLYMVWSPWHYMGQNYGIALMFLGRRKIAISGIIKRLIHISFLFSFLLTLTEIQSFPSSEGFYQVLTLELSGVQRDILYGVFGTGYILTVGAAVYALLRLASLDELLPTLLLICTQALWFLVPLFAIRFGVGQGTVALSMDHAVYAFFWVAIAHAIQYLWITSYFAANQEAGSTVSGFLGKALIAGALIWVVPVFLFSPGVLGNRSYDAGLAILIAAAVNIHHFMLDGAIWKLREGRVASILLRDSTVMRESGTRVLRPILKPALLVIGLLCVVSHYLATVSESSARHALLMGDLSAADRALSTLKLLQRDDAQLRRIYSQVALQQQKYDSAIESARVVVTLNPTDSNLAFFDLVQKRARDVQLFSEADGSSAQVVPFSPKLAR